MLKQMRWRFIGAAMAAFTAVVEVLEAQDKEAQEAAQ